MLAEVHPFTAAQARVVEGAAWLNMTRLPVGDPGRELDEAVCLDQPLRLSPLARARRSQKDQSHDYSPPGLVGERPHTLLWNVRPQRFRWAAAAAVMAKPGRWPFQSRRSHPSASPRLLSCFAFSTSISGNRLKA